MIGDTARNGGVADRKGMWGECGLEAPREDIELDRKGGWGEVIGDIGTEIGDGDAIDEEAAAPGVAARRMRGDSGGEFTGEKAFSGCCWWW